MWYLSPSPAERYPVPLSHSRGTPGSAIPALSTGVEAYHSVPLVRTRQRVALYALNSAKETVPQ
eukprot:3941258-Rhodomonas_salina.1